MSLLNSFHLHTIAPDNTGIFLLSAQEMKASRFSSHYFTVHHSNGLGTLTLGFDYEDDKYVERGEFEDIHLNVGDNYCRHKANGWHKLVGEYVLDVVRLWKLIQAAEPFYADFQIISVHLRGLDTDLCEDDRFVRWIEELVAKGDDMDVVEDVLGEFQEYLNR